MTAYTITATNSVGSTTATLNLSKCTVPPPTATWTVETSTVTKDLLALYPTATAFRFKGVGGGGGGEGGPARQNATQSMFTKPGGSGGGVFDVTVPVSQITAAVTMTVGAGGVGSTGAVYNAASPQVALPGGNGGASQVTVGGTVLTSSAGDPARATGGSGGMDINKFPVWPKGGVGNLATGGQAQGASGAVAGQPNYYDNSSFDGAAVRAAAWTVIATGPGAGGTSSGFRADSVGMAGQSGQSTSTGAAGGAFGPASTGAASSAAASDGGNGQALTDGTLTYGAGGGGGGLGGNATWRGGAGGDGGWPGGGGGAGGGGTTVNPSFPSSTGGKAGNGGAGLVMWIPLFN